MVAEAALLLLIAAWGHATWHRARGRRSLARSVARFTPRPERGTFEEAAPRAYFGPRKQPHGVLLLHGYTASAAAFKHLTPELERLGIPYYAPNLTGHGLDGGTLLEAARTEDWLRDAWQAYDLVAAAAEEVSVVGFSYGTLLACELAAHRPVRHLVLVAPYLHLKSESQRKIRRRLAHPALAWLAMRLQPYVNKRKPQVDEATNSDLRDPSAAAGLFAYPVTPLRSLLAMWRTPNRPDWAALKPETLDILYGTHDQTSDVPALLAELEACGVPHRARAFAESGHNLLEDFDRAEAVQAIAQVLGGSLRHLDARPS